MEVKAGLRLSTMVRKLDACCPKGHRPSHNTSSNMQTQETTAKKPYTEESRLKEAKQPNGKALVPPRSEPTEPEKSSCTDQKKEYHKKKRNQKNYTPGNRDNANAIEVGKKKKRDNQYDRKCYNCQKKGHF